MSINKVILVGNVGKDPEIRHLQGGASVATITLATSERYKDRSGETRELTEWHTIIAWRQLADLLVAKAKQGVDVRLMFDSFATPLRPCMTEMV